MLQPVRQPLGRKFIWIYTHDHSQKVHVALSMVNGATSFHVAVLLQNRKANYVARKFYRHWCSLYGIPEVLFFDGGEFGGSVVSSLDGWNLMEFTRSAQAHRPAEQT